MRGFVSVKSNIAAVAVPSAVSLAGATALWWLVERP
jgi:hypothetical protein